MRISDWSSDVCSSDLLAVVGAVMEGDAVVALGDRTEVLDVGFGTGPPDAVHFVARIADGLRLAYGRRRHDAGAPEQDEVRTALAYLQPRGFLLNARRGNGI